MEREMNKKPGTEEETNATTGNEQGGRFFTEKNEIHPGEGLLHHGRPLSDMEIEELRVHKENNEFLGITDTPEVGTGAGNVGGVIPDASDLQRNSDQIDLRHNPDGFSDELSNGIDSNFGRNYQGGTQSQNHFIETHSQHKNKKKEDKK